MLIGEADEQGNERSDLSINSCVVIARLIEDDVTKDPLMPIGVYVVEVRVQIDLPPYGSCIGLRVVTINGIYPLIPTNFAHCANLCSDELTIGRAPVVVVEGIPFTPNVLVVS